MSYIDRIALIAMDDAVVLKKKDAEYGGSWLRRGGIGAFMMLARKWDRLETAMQTKMSIQVAHDPKVTGGDGYSEQDFYDDPVDKFDIITRAVEDGREEGILDDIGDLRRYLLLVEAEIRERMAPKVNHVEREAKPKKLDPFGLYEGASRLPDGTCLDGPQE